MNGALKIPSLEKTPFILPIEIDNSQWNMALEITLCNVVDGSPALNPTKVLLGLNNNLLLIRFQCTSKHIRTKLTEPGAAVWEEEAVEVFLQPPGFSNTYFEIDLNPLNTTTQLKICNNGAPGDKRVYEGDTHWRCSGLITRTFIDGHLNTPGQCSGWTAELAIPLFSLLGGHDCSGLWRANFFRVDASSENLAYRAWLPTGEIDFHRMENFGQLCIG
ncbi:MAG: carbohydrate-binding family 9-like protein [Bacteroidia bacterium]|jgi:hypothetical protein|nr:carbohydrate-binding family 9-like protein [Bacteroidia bacterium]